MTDDPRTDRPARARDRREHGGAPARPDDDALAARTAAERAAAGLADYDPGDVPPATDTGAAAGVADSGTYREAQAEVKRQIKSGEMDPDEPLPRSARRPYPPTR